MFCTRRFTDRVKITLLTNRLMAKNIEYEVTKPKKAHMALTPNNQKFIAIVSWFENV